MTIDLEAIKARMNAATPGPWFHKEGVIKHYVYSKNEDLGFSLQELHPIDGREWPTEATAKLIAHSRQDIPALVEEIERFKSKLSKWQNWQPDDGDLSEMKRQAQGLSGTYTDSLAANAVYIHGLEARLRRMAEENARLRAEINGFLTGDVQPEELKD